MILPLSDIALRLVTATALSSLIGLDRERQDSAAGLRTHALVGMSSCLLMIASAFGFADILGTPNVSLDPSRIAAQIVTGIGFVGAGAIIANGSTIRGLTTAASVWSVAAIGLAVGGGMYWAAVIATAISLVLLVVLRPWERRLDNRWRKQTVSAVFDPRVTSLEGILSALHAVDLHASRLSVEKTADSGSQQVQITLEERGATPLQNAVQILVKVNGVQSASAE